MNCCEAKIKRFLEENAACLELWVMQVRCDDCGKVWKKVHNQNGWEEVDG